jgi:hypothetical protein
MLQRFIAAIAKNKLLDIYNQLWIADSFPNELKEALVVPVLRPGKDPNLPTSYTHRNHYLEIVHYTIFKYIFRNLYLNLA